MAKRAGAYVFATVSTEEKAALATEAGADSAIIYTRDDFEKEVMKATDGRGCQAVYDSVGQTTFEKSLNCLARRGCLALYGQSSGPVSPVATGSLRASSYLTRPSLVDHTATREELEWRAGEVLGWVASGELKVRVGGEFPLQKQPRPTASLRGATPQASSFSSRRLHGHLHNQSDSTAVIRLRCSLRAAISQPVPPIGPRLAILVRLNAEPGCLAQYPAASNQARSIGDGVLRPKP